MDKENKKIIYINEMNEKAYNHLGINVTALKLNFLENAYNNLLEKGNKTETNIKSKKEKNNKNKLVSKVVCEKELTGKTKEENLKNIPVKEIFFSEKLKNKIYEIEKTNKEKSTKDLNEYEKQNTGNIEYIKMENEDIFLKNINIDSKNETKNILIELDVKNKEENKIKENKINENKEKREEIEFYRNLNLNISADNSKLNIIFLVKNSNSFSLDNINLESKNKGCINFRYVLLGESCGNFNHTSKVYKDSKIDVSGIYYLKNLEYLNFMYNGILKEEKAKAHFNIDGIMDNNSSKISKDILNFENGAKGSIGIENEKIIVLSDDVKMKTAPILLSEEEDIIGEHGFSSGALDKNKMFYLNSRGLSELEAKYIIINSKIEKIFENTFENENKSKDEKENENKNKKDKKLIEEKKKEIEEYIKQNIF